MTKHNYYIYKIKDSNYKCNRYYAWTDNANDAYQCVEKWNKEDQHLGCEFEVREKKDDQ